MHRYCRWVVLLSMVGLLFSACGLDKLAHHELAPAEVERNRLFAEILKRSDRRDLGSDGFLKQQLLTSPHREVREWVAVALGRIGDPRSLPWLYEAFRSTYAAVRAAAAFALGEIEDREILRQESRAPDPRAAAQLTLLLEDSSLSVQMRAIEALGKIGSEGHAAGIIKRIESICSDGSPLHRAYLDLAITALMRLRASAALPVFTRLASNADPEIQWRVLNALDRMRLKEARPLFLSMLLSTNDDVRAHAARGLGICGDPDLAVMAVPLLVARNEMSGSGQPLKVRVSALAALSNMKNPASVPAIVSALQNSLPDDAHPEEYHFAVQAANTLGFIGADAGVTELRRLLHIQGPVADAALLALARILRNDSDRFFRYVEGIPLTSPASRRAWAEALGELSGSRATAELKSMLICATVDTATPSDFAVIPTVLAALAKSQDPDLLEILKPYLAVRDGVTLRAAVEAYTQAFGAQSAPDPVLAAYSSMESSTDVETKTALLGRLQPWLREEKVRTLLRRALGDRQRNVRIEAAKLLRMAGEAKIPSYPGPVDVKSSDNTYLWLAGVRKERSVAIIETTRGTIEIELFREDAPLTVDNFVSLARRGFYDGLTFMRVVPYFVIQGGDPRNDQEGGPGYTIRCEINMRPFERGSLGMALSGKDTGGSQFFITMAPQPHLDGGYTCFGHVISGMEVVDRVVAGDRIRKIIIEEDRTILDHRQF